MASKNSLALPLLPSDWIVRLSACDDLALVILQGVLKLNAHLSSSARSQSFADLERLLWDMDPPNPGPFRFMFRRWSEAQRTRNMENRVLALLSFHGRQQGGGGGQRGSRAVAIARRWWWRWQRGCGGHFGSLATARRHRWQHCDGKRGGSDSGGGQRVGSTTASGMAAVAAATGVLPPRAAAVAMKSPSVTVMAGAHTTIDNQLKSVTATTDGRVAGRISIF